MSQLQREARLHEKVVQQIARQALPKVQGQHTTKENSVSQRISITLVDDLDGSEANETVTFGLDGTTYEIDLSTANAETMRKNFAMYVEMARKVGGKSRRRKATPAPKPAVSNREVRQWAREQGIEVSTRGVVPASLVAQYEAAH